MQTLKVYRASLRRSITIVSATTLSLSLLGSVPATAQSMNDLGTRVPAPVFVNQGKVKPAVLDMPGRRAALQRADQPTALAPIIVPQHPITLSVSRATARKLAGPTVLLKGHIPTKALTATRVGPMDPTRELTLNLMLRPRNQAMMDDLVRRIYDPKDPMFHQYLTPAQRIANFSPAQEDFNTVVAFAQKSGLRVTDSSVDRQIVKATGTVAQIQSAFGLHLDQYQAADKTFFYAPDAEPQVPAAVAPLLFGMENLTDATRPHSCAIPRSSLPATPPSSSLGDTPADIGIYSATGMPAGEVKKVFNIAYSVGGTPITGAGQHVALVELGGFNQGDINYYIWYNANIASPSAYLNYTPIQTHLMGGYNGGTNSDTGECELDIEMLEAVADGLTQIDVYEEDYDGSVIDELNQILNDDTANQVSVSYDCDEDVLAGNLIEAEASSVMELMALQGQAVFVAGGDWGAYGKSGQALTVNGYAASPYATGVGGTTLWINEFSDYGAFWYEKTWNDGGASGGGISQYIGIPDYQYNLLVNDPYLGDAGASLQNRNVPDVALDSDPYTGYYTHIQGHDMEYGGTSAATPIWAGFWAHVNQYRAMYGIAPLGSANPALYQVAGGSNYNNDFRDVYGGSNNNYYYDTYGYDCTTGLGTLNAINMINDLVNYGSYSPSEYFYIQQPEATSGQQITLGVDLFDAPAPNGAEGTATVTYAILNGSYVYWVGQDTVPYSASSDSINITAPDVQLETTEQYICYVTYYDVNGKEIGPSRWSNYYPITLFPNGIKSVSVAPSVAYDAQGATGTVTLGVTAAGNEVVALTSSDPTHASVPSTVTVTPGNNSVTFPITTKQVATSEQVTITAQPAPGSTLGAFPASGQFTICPLLSSFSIAPTSVVGGNTAGGTISLAQSTPVNLTLNLTSSNPAVTVPATVVVPAGQTSATFPITTRAVAANVTATVTVTEGAVTKAATLHVQVGGPIFTLSNVNGIKNANGTYTGLAVLTNTSASTVSDVVLTASQLGPAATSTLVPLTIGTMAPNASVSGSFTYPASAGKSGTKVTLTLNGTYTGGTWTISIPVTLP
jgi:subtilase family serine protease